MPKQPLLIEALNAGANLRRGGAAMGPLSQTRVSEAMYYEDGFRLLMNDLEGYSHVLSSREGLYAISLDGVAKIADGQFFGVTVYDEAIYCFEALGPIPSFSPHRGRIVRLSINNKRILSAEVVVKGLPNGCHQIDFIGRNLVVCDTYNSRLFSLESDFHTYTSFLPWGDVGFEDFAAGYPHVNSVVGFDGATYLMLHNCSRKTGRRSQIS